MNLKIFTGTFMSVFGILTILLGILFIIASKNEGSRLATGIVLIGTGTVMLVPGIILFKKGILLTPEGIGKKILKLAGKHNGHISMEVITAEVGDSDAVRFKLIEMTRQGVSKEIKKDGRLFYIFRDFQPKLMVKKCPYCGNDYPVRDNIENCLSCGGDLKIKNESVTMDDDKFSLDG